MEQSRLLSLPKELRLDIWRHVLTDTSIDKLVLRIYRKAHSPSTPSIRFSNSVYKTTHTALPQFETAFETPRNRSINLNLLVTNRSIYEEALPILYHSVRFCPQDQGGVFPLFLQGLSSFAQSHVHYIKLYVQHCNSSPFYWAIICSQIASLDDSLREIQVEGDWPLTTNLRKRRVILCSLLKINTPKKFVPAHDSEFQQLLLDAARDRDARATLQQKSSITAKAETGPEVAECIMPIESRKREHVVQEMVIRKKARWDTTPPNTSETAVAPNLNVTTVTEQFDGEVLEWDLISMGRCLPNLAIRPESMVSDDTCNKHVTCNSDDGNDDDGSEDWEFIDTLLD